MFYSVDFLNIYRHIYIYRYFSTFFSDLRERVSPWILGRSPGPPRGLAWNFAIPPPPPPQKENLSKKGETRDALHTSLKNMVSKKTHLKFQNVLTIRLNIFVYVKTHIINPEKFYFDFFISTGEKNS